MFNKIKLYFLTRNIKDTTQVTDDEYYQLLRFKTPEDVVKLFKVVMTRQMFNHWEARDDSEKQKMARGAANLCKIVLDAHRAVITLEAEEENVAKKQSLWQHFKKKYKIF